MAVLLDPTPSLQALGSRSDILGAVLDPSRLPTPPAVALQIIQAVTRPDCRSAEIVRLLALDSALCAKVLRALNSCLFGLSRPVASLDRAVAILGLNPLRALVVGLSLPAMHIGPVTNATREYWVSSVSGAILAREVAVRRKHPAPEDDMVAGLLRDLGEILLQRTYPNAWHGIAEYRSHCPTEQVCRIERDAFGIDHADVTAELLLGWQLPEEIVQPIRHHHEPDRLVGAPKVWSGRAGLLYFVELLTRLDTVTQHPDELSQLLTRAEDHYGLPQAALIAFLERVAPKISEFAKLLNLDLARSPEFARALSAGSEALVGLAIATSRSAVNGPLANPQQHFQPADTITHAAEQPIGGHSTGVFSIGRSAAIPEFSPEFIPALPPCGCRLGGFELRELLGRGAMGVVFKAYEPSLDRFVAVKVLAPELASNATARQRFAREARIAAAIRHENVVAIYSVQEIEGTAYLAMEYVEGASLEELIETRRSFSVEEVIQLGGQVAAGLAAAHARGIVHRDIKPANILVENETGRAKITDFGLAIGAADHRLSREGSLIGTPLFMAPEQIVGGAVTTRTDLFGLGGVMYALCTSEPPFSGERITDVLRRVCEQEPLAPRQLRSNLPEWLEAVVLKLLSKKPEARFQSASEVAKLLAAPPCA